MRTGLRLSLLATAATAVRIASDAQDSSLAPSPVRRTNWRKLEARNYTFSFEEYLEEYGKAYDDVKEYGDRKRTYELALAEIRDHNGAGRMWKKGLSEHTDKFDDEWKRMRGYKRSALAMPPNPSTQTSLDGLELLGALPKSLDWRKQGIVSAVKNQGGCGSCWAFSATESVESAVAKATGKLLTLSPQQFVDCVPNPRECGGTGGCGGSVAALAFNWTVRNGLALSDAYPYSEKDGTCKKKANVGISGWTHLPTNNYATLMHAVATAGPISISASDVHWTHYEEGIFDGDLNGKCEEPNGVVISHVIQLVGYGSDGGHDYWLIRNSWGTSWGEEGYMKLRRFGEGKEPCGTDFDPAAGSGCKGGPSQVRVCGLCGMLSDSSYPTGGYVGNK